MPSTLQSFLEPWLLFLSDDPLLRLLQGAMLLLGALVIFLVFYATRDILLRTNSFAFTFICIVLVAALPIVGFLIYMLIRPPRTLRELEIEAMLLQLTEKKVVDTKKVNVTKKKTKKK